MNNIKTKIAIALNLVIFICEAIALGMTIHFDGLGLFKFYTQDSNILLGIFALIYAIFSIICLVKKEENIPEWVFVAKYIVTCLTTVTFIVVLAVLIPMAGGYTSKILSRMLLWRSNVFMHTLCPILALISFIFFENNYKLNFTKTLLAVLPTFLYALTTVILNVAKVLDGPYPFLKVYNQPVYMSIFWCCAILLMAFIIALALWGIKKITNKN